MIGRPLDGVKILDFGWILIGPQCTEYLASLGATVIRVESQAHPDIQRRMPLVKDGVPGLNRAGWFNSINRGKQSIFLNLSHPRAERIAKEIVRKWQPAVVFENFVPGTMKRRGLGYDDIKAIKPDIVYCSCSLLGQTGPGYWHRGWGPTLQARAGLAWLTGYPNEEEPITLSGYYPDHGMAGFLASAILMALWHRMRTGQGQNIDFSMNDGIMHTIADALMDHAMNGRVQSRRGNRDPLFVPQGVYRCSGSDNWVAISIADSNEWRSLCTVIGRPELGDDPRFADLMSRAANHDEIDAVITEWTKHRSNTEVQQLLQNAGIAAGAVVDTEQFLQNPHLNARGFFGVVDHDEVGPSIYGGIPVHMNEGELRLGKAPLFGQHTEEFYTTVMGYTVDEIRALAAEKVVY